MYLSDGFESGSVSAWNPGGTGQATAQTSVVNTGTYAAALTNASGQYEILQQNLSGGAQTLTYTRFYFRYTAGMGTTTLATGGGATGNMFAIVFDSGRQGLDGYFWNDARTRYDLYTNANVLTPNTWYSIEIAFNESTAGSATIYINGVNVASAIGDMSSSSGGYGRLYLWNEAAGTIYYDDVEVANTFI
jgi:hypothetical protein